MNFRTACIACALSATGLASPVRAQTSIPDAIAKGRPVIDLRARYEAVDDAGKTVTGKAGTLRARLGYETGVWNGLSVQADFDQIWTIGSGGYNSTRNGKTSYPVVADPSMTALNRLQLTYASDFDTKFILGRQRLLIGNQRFVGNAGWRQHEQTFDALSAVNTSIQGLTLTYAWLYRVNRVNGPDIPVPSNTAAAATGQANYFKSSSHVLDGVYVGVPGLRLEGYAFLLDLAAPGYATLPAQQLATARLSTSTLGIRGDYAFPIADGVAAKITGEFAHQSKYANNPLAISLNYWLGEGSVTWQGLTGLVGYEVLEGNGTIGFATPLATLHAFNGWADMFLATPANGLKDLYSKATYALPADFIGAKSLNSAIVYHDYRTDALGQGIGTEWDLQAELTLDSQLSLMAKYANYAGSGAAFGGFADKSIFWLQTAYKY
ncbi:MAG: hypothetical protein JF627_03720 [Alphaproteobacteria bacterium]|nr:hypothetical protein [Alphaproteobacteria bacterium]